MLVCCSINSISRGSTGILCNSNSITSIILIILIIIITTKGVYLYLVVPMPGSGYLRLPAARKKLWMASDLERDTPVSAWFIKVPENGT